MSRIWVMEEFGNPPPSIMEEGIFLTINFADHYPDGSFFWRARNFKVLNVTESPDPKMGFDEWW